MQITKSKIEKNKKVKPVKMGAKAKLASKTPSSSISVSEEMPKGSKIFDKKSSRSMTALKKSKSTRH